MARPDISDRLVHFTRGISLEDAFTNLCSIVDERVIRGGNAHIKGRYDCVCFTEAPLASLADGFVNPAAYSRYSPFGVVFDKTWIFAQGGRPAIYQSDGEFEALPHGHRWRHMRYEPTATPPIDFTWEREWRVPTQALTIDPRYAGIVLPAGDWARRLQEAHDEQQAWYVYAYSELLDTQLAEQDLEPFGWRIFPLGGD